MFFNVHRYNNDSKMKLAAIDIGTNSIHMVIVEVGEHRIFEIIDREREMVQLGSRSLLRGHLTQESFERGLMVLLAFRAIADSHRVDKIICTATSAVREASNGRQFVRLVKEQTGIDVRVLSGKEEARMVTLAVRDVIDLKNRRALIVDIGGGSMELIVADARHIFFSASLKAGVIRLTERFIKHDPPSSTDLKELRKWLRKKLEPVSRRIQDLAPEVAIGTSGTMLAMGEIVEQSRKGNRGLYDREIISIEEVEAVNEELHGKNSEERIRIAGLDRKRADQIVAGGALIELMMEKCRVNELLLCDRALREGLIADYLIRQNPLVPARIQARELRSRSVLNLVNRWEIDRVHAEHTAMLSLQMFDALSSVHEYGPKVRELMEYTALLHDIGRVISYPGHHKHGWYIIKHANLIGFQAYEIEMIAAAVVCHRGMDPNRTNPFLGGTSKKNRRIVRLLSGILRIADSLDRQHNQSIRKIVAVQERPRRMSFVLYADQPAVIPLRAAIERSDLLQDVLKLRRIEFQLESTTNAHAVVV